MLACPYLERQHTFSKHQAGVFRLPLFLKHSQTCAVDTLVDSFPRKEKLLAENQL